jgi:hypothetical protein
VSSVTDRRKTALSTDLSLRDRLRRRFSSANRISSHYRPTLSIQQKALSATSLSSLSESYSSLSLRPAAIPRTPLSISAIVRTAHNSLRRLLCSTVILVPRTISLIIESRVHWLRSNICLFDRKQPKRISLRCSSPLVIDRF